MNKKIIGLALIAVLFIVVTASLSYFASSQPSQTENSPFPTLTPTPTATPTPSPSEEPTEPASIPKPAVPEFTLKAVDGSYDVPPTYGINQFTGETEVTQPGYHVENKTIVLTMKNQPFTPYTDTNSNRIRLYYNIRIKGQFTEDWTELWRKDASDSDYTTTYYLYGKDAVKDILTQITSGYKVEFQVQAAIGHIESHHHPDAPYYFGWYDVFTGETSDWSSTQTLTIP